MLTSRVVNKFTLAEQLWTTRLKHKCDTLKSIDLKFAVDQIYLSISKNNTFSISVTFCGRTPILIEVSGEKCILLSSLEHVQN